MQPTTISARASLADDYDFLEKCSLILVFEYLKVLRPNAYFDWIDSGRDYYDYSSMKYYKFVYFDSLLFH